MNGLDLFSGIGGISQALAPWVRTVAYCERDLGAQRILLSRMYRGEIEQAPIWDDVRTLRGSMLPPIDVITGGFPCQDLSSAGLQKGLGGERSGLFYQICRLAKETEAPILFLENVKGVAKFIPSIRNEIESMGYECRDGFFAAGDIGARHKRERWFLCAYSNRFAKNLRPTKERLKNLLTDLALENGENPNTASDRCKRGSGEKPRLAKAIELLGVDDWDEVAGIIRRNTNGLLDRRNRLRALGNGVVPIQVEAAFQILTGIRG